MLNFQTLLIAFGLLCLFIFLIARQTDSQLTAAPAVNAHWSGKDMVLPVGKEYAAFFSHRKKGDGAQSEWVAILFKNITWLNGWNTFMDWDAFVHITQDELKKNVEKSLVVYTVIDEDTFDSSWVVLENETARDNNVLIYPIYNSNHFSWQHLVDYWKNKGLDFVSRFKMQAPYAYDFKENNTQEFMDTFVSRMVANGAKKTEDGSSLSLHPVDQLRRPRILQSSLQKHIGFLHSGKDEHNIFADVFVEICHAMGYKVALLNQNPLEDYQVMLVLLTSDLFDDPKNQECYAKLAGRPVVSIYDSNASAFSTYFNAFIGSYGRLFEIQSIAYSKFLNQYAILNFFRIHQAVTQ